MYTESERTTPRTDGPGAIAPKGSKSRQVPTLPPAAVEFAGERGSRCSSLGPGHKQSSYVCQLAFTIANVTDAAIYTIESGRRGSLSCPRDDLAAQGWQVSLSIGH